MAIHIDVDDPKYRNAAAEILRRHDRGEPEANITSAVRDFLIVTGLARSEEMVEENPPSGASRRAVDLTALDTFIEFKRRIGTSVGGEPNPQYVEQLDDYLAQSASQGRVRMGILTDGKRWLLRWPGAGDVRLTRPYAFTLEAQLLAVAIYFSARAKHPRGVPDGTTGLPPSNNRPPSVTVGQLLLYVPEITLSSRNKVNWPYFERSSAVYGCTGVLAFRNGSNHLSNWRFPNAISSSTGLSSIPSSDMS